MIKNFWQKRHIFALAPMDDVTDTVFRRMVAKYGKPDIMFTEFISCDGLCSAEGQRALRSRLLFDKSERPLVAQFFGNKPENFYKCARMANKLGFDGVDINMGCPDKNVRKQGAGAELMLNYSLAKEIIAAAKNGAGGLPVSVKTRLGYHENNIEKWMEELLQAEPAAIIMHGRTAMQKYSGLADWKAIAEAARITNGSGVSIIGNGDIKSMSEAKEKIKKYGVDGVMVGRAAMGNPQFFEGKNLAGTELAEKLEIIIEHARLFEKVYRKKRNFNLVKKHFAACVTGFSGAKNIREKLLRAKDASETAKAVSEILVEKQSKFGSMYL